MEQLQSCTSGRSSASTSKRTAPQWHPPVYVFTGRSRVLQVRAVFTHAARPRGNREYDRGMTSGPSPLDLFHPAVAGWFSRVFPEPTAAQRAAWPAIRERRHTLVAAPTGSGKTLAAFLAALDDLVREGLERGLGDSVHVLYVSPLRALSNDIHKNLEIPLSGIADALNELRLPAVGIGAAVRTGDTPQGERERMRRHPPHILVTTPESLFILLTSESGREM